MFRHWLMRVLEGEMSRVKDCPLFIPEVVDLWSDVERVGNGESGP